LSLSQESQKRRLVSNHNLQLQTAQVKLVSILDDVEQIGAQTLTVQISAVRTANILNQVCRASLMNLAVTTRYAISWPYLGGEVHVRNDPVCCIETPNVNLGGGWQ
jgi:hypothetical protein